MSTDLTRRTAVPSILGRGAPLAWIAFLICFSSVDGATATPHAKLVDVQRIWDQAPHNAFTDLVRYRDTWYCSFREGTAHVSNDGALRIISSVDGKEWEPTSLIKSPTGDLRDPKLTITPANQLMLTAAEAIRKGDNTTHQSLVWFSDDGKKWSEPTKIGDPDYWLWRTTWHEGVAYSLGYGCRPNNPTVRLYKSDNGKSFDVVEKTLYGEGSPNESSMVFLPDHRCYCLLRRDGQPASALLGRSSPPYRDWEWKDLGVKIGGPRLIRLPNGQFLAAVRLSDGGVRTALCSLDPEAGKLIEILKLPSGGDTSYAGLVWHDELLWMSYYSSHEGRASIYLAKIRIE